MASLDLFVSVSLVNALLLGAAALAGAVRDRRWGWVAALWLLFVVVMGAILVQHRTEGRIETMAVAVEQIAWASGPILYNFIRAATGHRVTARSSLPHFILPAAIVMVGSPLILGFGYEPLPEGALILFQLAYTGAAMAAFLRRPDLRDRTLLTYVMPIGTLAISVAIHAGQLVRLSRWGDTYVDAVPVAAAALVLVVLVVVLALPHLLPRLSSVRSRYSRSGLETQEARRIFAAAEATITARGLFRRHDLTLGDVAEAMEVAPHRLSQALSEGGATSFAALVATLRMAEAKRLLLEPRNATVAVEPIGMEAGFRSRSAFYASFKKHTGLTPAEFRDQRATFMS